MSNNNIAVDIKIKFRGFTVPSYATPADDLISKNSVPIAALPKQAVDDLFLDFAKRFYAQTVFMAPTITR